MLVLSKGPAQRLDNTSITDNTEAEYSIRFSSSERKFCLSLLCNGSNSFLFVNATNIYQFKAKSSKIKPYILCFENLLQDFKANNLKKENKQKQKQKNTGVNGYE